MIYKNLDELQNIENKKILVRLDLNVPLEKGENSGVSDDTRIRYALETLEELSQKGAKVLILSHLGRPQSYTSSLSNKQLLKPLQHYWGSRPILFIDDLLAPDASVLLDNAPAGALILGENIRFYKGEEENSEEFSKQLARLGDIYVNDGFSVSHRAHASTVGITRYLPSYAGRLLEKELKALQGCLETPKRPVMAIVGGSKVSTKLKILYHLLKKVEFLVVGGGMANTFLLAQGLEVGQSLCEKDRINQAKDILQHALDLGKKLILPTDVVVKNSEGLIRTIAATNVGQDDSILDAGPDSVRIIQNALSQCQTILWNGPLGLFEVPPFDQSTLSLAHFIADYTVQGRLSSIAGGGDTIAALNIAGRIQDFTYVSTAGGAFLEWLEGQTLPGIKSLER